MGLRVDGFTGWDDLKFEDLRFEDLTISGFKDSRIQRLRLIC
jgi:hypothetical protein